MRDKTFGNQGSGYPSGKNPRTLFHRSQHQEVPLRVHGEGVWVSHIYPIQLEHDSEASRGAARSSIRLEGRCREEGEEAEEGIPCPVYYQPRGVSLTNMFTR